MKIAVFHDIACPWCRIGKAHLKEALSRWDGHVDVTYHPFLLNANIPEDGADFESYMLAKGNYRMSLEQFFSAPREMGKQIGITFNFEDIEYAPNTIHAHRLISFVPADKQPALIDALYDAYFEQGRNVGDKGVLADIASELGYDRDTMLARLNSDENKDLLQSQLEQAQQLGITGVPFFVFNNMFAFSGAQPPDAILQAMRQSQTVIPINGSDS